MTQFRFEHPEALYFLLIIPLLSIWFIWIEYSKKQKIKQFAELHLLEAILPNRSTSRPLIKFVVWALAIFFFIIGFANPQVGSKLENVKRKGIEVIVALDVSNSMMAEDIKPNRLEKAKRTISQLIDKLHGDKLGLIVFAGQAYVQMPTTTDYSAAKMFLSTINPDIVPVQGTVLSEAIELAIESYTDENEKNKVLILISDGENHDDEAIQAAQEATQKNIKIYTVGMGLDKGTPIPVVDPAGHKDYRRDKNGDIVITKLNDVILKQIASAGQGSYIPASAISSLVDEFAKMDQQEFESKVFSDYEDRHPYFFALSFILLWLDLLLLNRKNKRLAQINLFNNNFMIQAKKNNKPLN